MRPLARRERAIEVAARAGRGRASAGHVSAHSPYSASAASPMPNAGDAPVTSSSSVAAKLALFGRLFRGRDDVFALRWQGKGGKSGYSPACAHEWDRTLCGKPRVKCAGCPNRVLLPLTEEVLQDHLTGRCTSASIHSCPTRTATSSRSTSTLNRPGFLWRLQLLERMES